jgi:hypothetical protein
MPVIKKNCLKIRIQGQLTEEEKIYGTWELINLLCLLGLNNQVLWLVSELLTMVKSHQDQYESNNSALDAKLADYQSRGLSLLFLRKR